MTREQVDIVHNLSIASIGPDTDQPRKLFDEEEEQRLADSIHRFGLQQPILVRPVEHPSCEYMIIYGERRYRAHKRLGLRTIKAIIREMGDSEARDLQLLENVQRKDLSDIELAWEFQRRTGQGQTHEQIAQVIGCKRAYVTQRLGLLRLSESDQKRMLRGELGFSQARALLSVRDPGLREKVSGKIRGETTVKETKRFIQEESNKLDSIVPRVTSRSSVLVVGLHVWSAIHNEDGSLRELVPRDELIWAYIEDLKRLGGGSWR